VDVAALPIVPPWLETAGRGHVREVPHAIAQVVKAHGGKAVQDEWMYVVGDNAGAAADAGDAGSQQRAQFGSTMLAVSEAARRAQFPSAGNADTANDAAASLRASLIAITDPAARATVEALTAQWGVPL
jgi:hypothetical protein